MNNSVFYDYEVRSCLETGTKLLFVPGGGLIYETDGDARRLA